MSNALFADISGFQPSVNWQQYVAWARQGDGTGRVLMKATEGVGFKDVTFAGHWLGAVNVGIAPHVYHYARPDLNKGATGASAEARWFASVVQGLIKPESRLMLDLEQNEDRAWAKAFYHALMAALPRNVKPVLYDSLSHFNQFFTADVELAGMYDAAIAAWHPLTQGPPAAPKGWRMLWWQYADNENVPGIGTRIDANVWLGGPPVVEKDWKQEQAADIWASTPYPNNTGIHGAWLAAYARGIVCGPPISGEIHTVDWAGNAIVAQFFGSGIRIEYYVQAAPGHPAGSHHGYCQPGKTLVQLW